MWDEARRWRGGVLLESDGRLPKRFRKTQRYKRKVSLRMQPDPRRRCFRDLLRLRMLQSFGAHVVDQAHQRAFESDLIGVRVLLGVLTGLIEADLPDRARSAPGGVGGEVALKLGN